MKNILCGISAIFFTFYPALSMDRPKQATVSFLTSEREPQEFKVSRDVALQCKTLKQCFQDTDSLTLPIPPVTINDSQKKDVLHFIAYLEKLHIVSKSIKTQNAQKSVNTVNREISSYTKTLTTPDLIKLFIIADHFEVIDKDKNCHITNEVADRIIQCSAKKESFHEKIAPFYVLNERPLFRSVVQEISKHINFEQIFIQPYADALLERHSLPRTVPIVTTLYYNIRNALTFFPRVFEISWAVKTSTRPYYLNNQTKTMITGFVQEIGSSFKTTDLCITKENQDQNIMIPLNNVDIAKITNIEANPEESVFICRSPNKTIVISLLDKDNPMIIDHTFVDCVFSSNKDELYAITNKDFGILNLQVDVFTSLQKLQADDETFTHIKTNSKGTIIAVIRGFNSMNMINDSVFMWEKNENNENKFNKKVLATQKINNICLHPSKDMICLEHLKHYSKTETKYDLCYIDNLAAENPKLVTLHEHRKAGNCLCFLPNADDILFLGSASEDDCFFNMQTPNNIQKKIRHLWIKKKIKSNERLWWPSYNNNCDDAYEHIVFTADHRQRIEQRAESNFVIDFLMAAFSNDKPIDLSRKRITVATLINKPIIDTMENIKAGFMPLEVVDIAQCSPSMGNSVDKAQIAKLPENIQKVIGASDTSKQWIFGWMKNIFYFSAASVALILKAVMTSADKVANTIILGTALLVLLECAAAQY